MRMIPMRSPFHFPLLSPPHLVPPLGILTRRRTPAQARRNLPCPGGRATGPDWRVDAAAAWRRRAQTLPLVDWGGADGAADSTKTMNPCTVKRLLRRLFVPP